MSEPADLERLLAVQRAIQKLATSPEAPLDPAVELARWGVREDDARALGSFSPERTGVYGWLIGRTVLDAVRNQLPITVRRVPEDELAREVQQFLQEETPRSPYLRDVPFEYVMWMSPRWGAGRPDYLPDLARFELLAFAAGAADAGPRPAAPEPLAPGREVWLDGSVHLARFRHAVHLLFDGGEPAERAPERRDVALLVYRDKENDVCWVELGPPAMEVLTRLGAGAALGPAIQAAARALGREVDAAFIEEISGVLADLSQRGALLGAAADGDVQRWRQEQSPYRVWLATGERAGD